MDKRDRLHFTRIHKIIRRYALDDWVSTKYLRQKLICLFLGRDDLLDSTDIILFYEALEDYENLKKDRYAYSVYNKLLKDIFKRKRIK